MNNSDDEFILAGAFQFLSKIVRLAEISEDFVICIPFCSRYILWLQYLKHIQLPKDKYAAYLPKYGDSFRTTWYLIKQQYKAIGVTIKYCCDGVYQ